MDIRYCDRTTLLDNFPQTTPPRQFPGDNFPLSKPTLDSSYPWQLPLTQPPPPHTHTKFGIALCWNYSGSRGGDCVETMKFMNYHFIKYTTKKQKQFPRTEYFIELRHRSQVVVRNDGWLLNKSLRFRHDGSLILEATFSQTFVLVRYIF